MKKRVFVLFTLCCLALAYATGFAQTQPDLSEYNIGKDGQVTQAQQAPPPDTPVNGIGDTLQNAYYDFLGQISAATSGLGSALTGQFQDLARIIVTLYLAITAILTLRGNGGPVKEAATTVFLVFLVSGIVFGGNFQTWVSEPIIGTINSLGDFMVNKSSGGQAGNIVTTLAGGMDKIMAACVQLDRVDSWLPTKLLAALIAQIALSATYLMVMVTFLLICIMTWTGIYLMNVFGAVCLFFVCFRPTRHIFWAWLRAMCNYGMVIVFASLIMAVCIKVMGPQLDKMAVMDYGSIHPLLNAPTYTCIAINVLSWCLLLRAPDLAAALTGGSAGNTAGIAGVVSMTAGAAYAGMKYMGMQTIKGGPQAASNVAGGIRGVVDGYRGQTEGPSARKGIDNSSY